MNRPIEELPAACDVLVVGAGPAGSAAALTLARAGLDTVLVDAQAFPRDKVCGDGLIPDARNAMEKLGVWDEVARLAQSVPSLACVGPRGGRVSVPGRLAVLPRRQLDDVLCRAAAAGGARMHAPVRFVGTLESDEGGVPRIVGARLQAGATVREVSARWVVLATGAVPQALIAAGVCERRTPSAIALRGYVRNPALAGRLKELEVLWHPRLKPGYGWIFPCPDGVFNVGVGVAHSHAKGHDAGRSMESVNLRDKFKAFAEVYPNARALVDDGEWVGELKGAPLRCSLEGARFSRPGLIVTGEAAGSTYAFTGEGIGKALETGILAGEAIVAGTREATPEAAVRAGYETRLAALRPRFAVYEKANTVNAHPWLVDLLAWSANRSPRRLKRMSGVLEETHVPGDLLSLRSWGRLLFERG
ncbi:FAD-dependent monooxygenase [Schlegelella sp. ID0723]|uniref:FAD-dependent monooxygenase n=2 Tax=Piscinibacter koreensis TaxID=2742824 RepID=A0A7Y6NJV9_9BURK|nr:FAD-dependent monooxygenase [Schlegelella koreensis]